MREWIVACLCSTVHVYHEPMLNPALSYGVRTSMLLYNSSISRWAIQSRLSQFLSHVSHGHTIERIVRVSSLDLIKNLLDAFNRRSIT